MSTHAAAYTQSGRDTGHALCGEATGPVSTDWDKVDCERCGHIHQMPAGNETDDGFNEWHAGHQARITGLQADARQQLQAALGQIIAARAELAVLFDERCEFDCACLPRSVHADIEALIADAERLLRAAKSLARPEMS